MVSVRFRTFFWASALVALFVSQGVAVPDAFLRDTVADTGVEPYAGAGPVYLSPDIWVRNDPDPNHEASPFLTTSPPWTPLAHENPEYRDSKTGRPNYVYVRIHNRGDQPTAGTERLRLYQAKASTGLAWSVDWVDNVGSFCGADRLLGIEITKPRRNAKSVGDTERNAYRDALLKIQTDSQYRYSDGVQYWRKQNSVHAGAGNPQHGNPAFLSWHREMMNRYEERLREADPLVTLLYWDWTEDPRAGVNLFTTAFMGASNGTVGAPLTPLQPPTLRRDVGGVVPGCLGFDSDGSFLSNTDFSPLATDIETGPNHDCAHGYIGGFFSGGQISFLSTAAQDPFFFMLHANVDRLWANWQRSGANPLRIDPVAAYGTDSSNADINDTMSPWDGATGLAPWTGPAAFGKTGKHPSVVYAPIYDTAPLNIPALQPGESVVIEIPWYPPDVNDYNCAGQAGHFCLLARIETAARTPFGMTFVEGVNVGTNTRNNNNIAWRNVTIVDNDTDPASLRFTSGAIVRNIFDREAIFAVSLRDRTEERRGVLPEAARVMLAVPEEIGERARNRAERIRDLEVVSEDDGRVFLRVVGKEPRFSIPMKPRETFAVQFVVELPDGDLPPELIEEPFHFDLEQHLDLPRDFFDRVESTEVGGVRWTVDVAQLLAERDRGADNVDDDDLRLLLEPEGGPELLTVDADADSRGGELHLAVGQPLRVTAGRSEGGDTLRTLSLDQDGREVVEKEGVGSLSETLRFDTPGLHTITTTGVDEDGRIVTRRTRVLVSDKIPPNAVITSPAAGAKLTLGESVEITAAASAAYGREVREVALYVKEGDFIATGLNLVASENYSAEAKGEGPGPHTFRYTPEKAGMYMFQVGATDDSGVVGVSRHAMIMVMEP